MQIASSYGPLSLFIANLPHRMSNLELAYALFDMFHGFGCIVLVRASRDVKGRPYGFVDYSSYCPQSQPHDGSFDDDGLPKNLQLDGRTLRVEVARFQAKLLVVGGPELQNVLAAGLSPPSAIRHIPATGQHSAILRFGDAETALAEHDRLRGMEGMRVSWMSGMTAGTQTGSAIRQSGMVQLAPINGHLIIPPYASKNGNHAIPSQNGHHLSHPIAFLPNITPPPSKIYSYEEEYYQSEGSDHHTVPRTELYIGRLSSLRVTRELLKERFGQYGAVRYIRLFNRGVFRQEAPVDAFAYLGFMDSEAAQRAISREAGECWLGQVMTVQPLNPGRAIKLRSFSTQNDQHSRCKIEYNNSCEEDFEIVPLQQ